MQKKNEKQRSALPLGTAASGKRVVVETHKSQTDESAGINEPHKPHVFGNELTFCVENTREVSSNQLGEKFTENYFENSPSEKGKYKALLLSRS